MADTLLGQEHPHRTTGKGGIKRGFDQAHSGNQRVQLQGLECEEGEGTLAEGLDKDRDSKRAGDFQKRPSCDASFRVIR